jgi:hypothetical protein
VSSRTGIVSGDGPQGRISRRLGFLDRTRKRIAAGLCFGTVALLTAGVCQAREVRFLTFSAVNRYGIFLRDLEQNEVQLKLDGKKVDVGYLSSGGTDTAVAIFLENSPRTAENSVSIPQYGQINLIDRVRYELLDDFFPPLCRIGHVMLAEFFEQIHILRDFTDDESYLLDALNKLQPHANGVVLDQIRVGRVIGRGVDILKARPERRKVLFLVTRTVDRESARNLEEYELMLRNTGVDVFVLSLAPRFMSGPGRSFGERVNTYFFENLVKETAGRAYLAGEYKFIEDAFTDLKGRLLNTYTIGFYVEPGPKVKDHEVEIRVSREKCRVTCRKYLVY